MTLDEQVRVVRITAERAAGRVPVIAGAGANDTRRAVELSRTMRDAGATHLLHVSPMYNKPPQRGLLAHFRAVAEATDLPVDPLQRARTHGREHRRRHHARARRAPEHHRHQGGVGSAGAGTGDPPPSPGGLQRALRRRPAHAADDGHGRRRRDLRGVECHARRHVAAGGTGARRRLGRRARSCTTRWCRGCRRRSWSRTRSRSRPRWP